jgi:hypothetical protein
MFAPNRGRLMAITKGDLAPSSQVFAAARGAKIWTWNAENDPRADDGAIWMKRLESLRNVKRTGRRSYITAQLNLEDCDLFPSAVSSSRPPYFPNPERSLMGRCSGHLADV